MLLKANNKPQMQERRPPLKIHFTIQLGYFTGVKKRRRGDARVYSSTIYGLVYLHFIVENGATAGRQTLLLYTSTFLLKK